MNRPYIQYNAVFPDFEELPGGGRFEIGNSFRGSSALHAVSARSEPATVPTRRKVEPNLTECSKRRLSIDRQYSHRS